VERAGFDWCTPHALRHAQVAMLIEAGEQPLMIARRLGHTSVRVILDTYGHLYEGADEAGAEKLDECQVSVPGRHFGSGRYTTVPRGLGSGVDPTGPAARVGEGTVSPVGVVADRVGSDHSSFL